MGFGFGFGFHLRRWQASSTPQAGPLPDSPGALDIETYQIGVPHTITAGTATATGGGALSTEFRWRVGGAEVATGPAYTPLPAEDGLGIEAAWRAVETGGSNDGASFWEVVGSGQVRQPAPAAAGTLPDLNVPPGVAISPLDVAADFTGGGLSYALAPGSDALPAGLVLSAAGLLSGTPTEETDRIMLVRGTSTGGTADTAFGLTVAAEPVADWALAGEENQLTLTSAPPVAVPVATGGETQITFTE